MSGRGDPARSWIAQRFGPARTVEPLAADASVRSFFRVQRPDGSSAVAMVDRAGGAAGVRRMVAAAGRLADVGVRVPRILEQDEEASALLLEDLGDRLLADVVDQLDPQTLVQVYLEAGRTAGLIAGIAVPEPDDLLGHPRLGFERLRSELAFFAVHDVARRRARAQLDVMRPLGRALDELARDCCRGETRLAHRDFHARNLLLLEDGSLGVVDFQDALPAPAHYDLVSLLWDPYVDLPETAQEAALAGYGEALGAPPPRLDEPEVVRIALQRVLKAIGTYARQTLDLGRVRFETFIPPAERRVRVLLGRLPAGPARTLRQALSEAGLDVG
jgi:hypothetical protein